MTKVGWRILARMRTAALPQDSQILVYKPNKMSKYIASM